IVLPDGTVMSCSCVASMDAIQDLAIGNIMEASLLQLWTNDRMTNLRGSFNEGCLNPTCSGCDMYRDLELYRTSEGRKRAELNVLRSKGKVARRTDKPMGPFAG